MHKFKFTKIAGLIFSFLLIIQPGVQAQGRVSRDLQKWFKIGYLQHYYSARGAEWGSNENTGLFDGLRYPAHYLNQDNFCIIRTWLVCRNFTDADGISWPYKSAFMGGMEPGNSIPMVHKMISKFEPPKVYVDGALSSEQNPGIDEIDPNLPCDRKIVNVVNTPLGVTMTRNIYAFSQQYHSNYFTLEYILENTGNTDDDNALELADQTVTDLYLGWLDHYANREAAWYVKGEHAWGKFLWVTQRGEDYDQYVAGDLSADSMRCNWAWLGKAEGLSWDNIGAPNVQGNGRLANTQYPGMVFLHVDTGPNDSTDNPGLPVMGWNGNDTHPASASNSTDVSAMGTLWNMFAGNSLPKSGQYGGYDRMDERSGQYPAAHTDPGGSSALAGFGPYTLEPGESVRIVVAEGVAGLNRQLCEDIGYQWKNGSPPFTLPDGRTTTDADQYKNSWVFTGEDSIIQTFSRARRCFENDMHIPTPPRPPQSFYVNSGGDRINLSWQDPLLGYGPNFAGFKIFRAIGKPDTVYQEIFSCTLPDTVHSFNDRTPQRGFSYYYYIVSFSDGSNNSGTMNPSGPLVSSRFYTQTTLPAYLKRQAGDDLKDIRVVPNPYYIAGRSYQYGVHEDRDKIMFLNIPGKCTIRIFTERGDLIKTIEHTDGSGDEAWNSNTMHRQVVVSGIYIVHFETPGGKSTFRKMIIIR